MWVISRVLLWFRRTLHYLGLLDRVQTVDFRSYCRSRLQGYDAQVRYALPLVEAIDRQLKPLISEVTVDRILELRVRDFLMGQGFQLAETEDFLERLPHDPHVIFSGIVALSLGRRFPGLPLFERKLVTELAYSLYLEIRLD